MFFRCHNLAFKYQQRGTTLVLSLIMLVILTILGTTAMNGSTLNLKMTSNAIDSAMSFEEAEGMRADAEERVRDIAEDMRDGEDFPNGQGLYDVAGGDSPEVLMLEFWENPDNYHSDGYVIEYLGEQDVTLDDDKDDGDTEPMNIFRITVRGEGTHGASTALQAVYMQSADD